MEIWLCPVKTRSWQKIREAKIFGAPTKILKIMKQVKIGDILVICIISPKKGIIAVCKTISEVYVDNTDLWGKDRYPLRINLEIVYQFENILPFGLVYGGSLNKNITVEPFLKNIWITKMSEKQYLTISKNFK